MKRESRCQARNKDHRQCRNKVPLKDYPWYCALHHRDLKKRIHALRTKQGIAARRAFFQRAQS